jgi:hypothetical protein
MNFEDFDAEISHVAPLLHREWDSPELWDRIAAQATRRRGQGWRWGLAAAASVLLAVVLIRPALHRPAPADSVLLTDEALGEVQRAEAVYARSIEKLSAVAAPTLQQSPAPLAAAYREKIELLDSAIADLKRTAAGNLYNAYLERQLASLYREKQKTLQDWLENAKQGD